MKKFSILFLIMFFTPKQKKKITGFIKEIQSKLLLNQYRIVLRWEDNPENSFAAHTSPDARYLRAIITFNYPMLAGLLEPKKEDWKELYLVCLHEMVHILLNPLVHAANERFIDTESFITIHERTTEHLTRLLK